jgi:hypothetical protein
VLLPGDTNRKFIASITAVLLPFMTYLLTVTDCPSYWDKMKEIGDRACSMNGKVEKFEVLVAKLEGKKSL